MNNGLQVSFTFRRYHLLVVGAVLALVAGIIWAVLYFTYVSPVPPGIKSQTDFKVIYPSGQQIDASSWDYQSQEKILVFTVKKADYTVTLTEQKLPANFVDDAGAYDRFIGGLKAYSNFKSPIGTVSLTRFVVADNFQRVGGTAIANNKGTLLVANASKDLSDDEWRELFHTMRVSR